MAYDEGLADRLRELLDAEPAVVAKKMFGGLVVMVDGNMAVGVSGDDLLVRAGPEETGRLLGEPGVRPFVMGGGRAPKGFVVVAAEQCVEDADLARWVGYGVAFARSLAPK